MSQNATPAMQFAVTTSRSPDNAICKGKQGDTSKMLRLPCKITMEVSKVLRLPRKMQLSSSENDAKKYCACPTKPFLTRHETFWNVTNCYACRAKRHYNLL